MSRVTRRTPRDLDLLILRALAETDWWSRRVEPRLVTQSSGCVTWTGGTNGYGYGQVALPVALGVRNAHGKAPMVQVHRAALVRSLGGPLGDGMQAGHVCHDEAFAAGLCIATDADPCSHRLCVAHVVEQSARENTLAGGSVTADNAARVTCLRCGALLVSVRGQRRCPACLRDHNAARNAAIRDAHKALGITQRAYRATFSQSRVTAEAITQAIATGVRPEVILAGARAVLAADGGVLGWIDDLRMGGAA